MAIVLIGFCGLIGGFLGLFGALLAGAEFLPAILFMFIGYFIAGMVAVYILFRKYTIAEHSGAGEDMVTKGKVGLRLGTEFDLF